MWPREHELSYTSGCRKEIFCVTGGGWNLGYGSWFGARPQYTEAAFAVLSRHFEQFLLPCNLFNVVADGPAKPLKPAVVVLGGSFNPVHHGHFRCLLEAADYAEQELNYKVLACCLAPAHDGYLRQKMARKQVIITMLLNYLRCNTVKEPSGQTPRFGSRL